MKSVTISKGAFPAYLNILTKEGEQNIGDITKDLFIITVWD